MWCFHGHSTAHCTLHNAQCIMCTGHNASFILHTAHTALRITLHTAHYRKHWLLNTSYSTLYIAYTTKHTSQSVIIFTLHRRSYYPVVPAVVGTTSRSDMTGFEALRGCHWQDGLSCFCHIFLCISHLLQCKYRSTKYLFINRVIST